MKKGTSAVIRIALVALFIAGILGVNPAYAETTDFGWVQGGGGPNPDYGMAMAVDSSGNAYFTGFVTNGPENEDGFLNKWDVNGNPIWATSVAGPASDANHDLALDGDGNVYVAGAFSDTVEFDPGNPAGNLTSAGLTDIFIIKYDGDGNFIWVKGVGGTSGDGGYGIAVDENGNIYLTGLYAGTVDFDPGSGTSNLTSAGFGDIFVLKLDAGGNFVWAKSMGGTSGENGFDIAVDGNGHVITTGFFDGTADFDPGAGTSNLTSAGQSDIFLSKLDTNGNFLWARQVGGTDFDRGFEVTVDGNGNIYLAGHSGYDILISKLDQDGQFLWQNIMGGIGADAANGIALDAAQNVYVTGEFGGTVDFDPGPGTSNLTSMGSNDIFISKLDTDGNFLWAKNPGGTSLDIGEDIVVRNDNSLYFAGSFSDTVDFDPGAGTSTLTSGGDLDLFISKQSLTPQTHYVKWNADGTGEGSSWENAYTDLQSALAAADPGDEIWVAAGTYKPTSGTDRTISFTLKNGVAVYGGFAGIETLLSQRNYETNVTVLSGDIGASGDNSDNSYHVVVGSNTDNSAILDGFTVTAGNADSSSLGSDQSRGGGMYNYLGSPRITNVIFRDNHAVFGGGMNNDADSIFPPVPDGQGSDPVLTNVSFIDNSAIEGGGIRNEDYSSPVLTNVILDGNHAVRAGGGMENLAYNQPVLTNVIFANNSVSSDIDAGGGGGLMNTISNPTLINVTFRNNSAPEGGGMFNAYSNPSLVNVTFSQNTATQNGGGISNQSSSHPLLTNVTFSENMSATVGGGIYNDAFGSNATIRNSIFYSNSGGEIYNAADVANVTYSIVQGGYTGTGNMDADPLLGPLQDNGGFTQTMALGAGSPAINAGDDASCPDSDQRGVTRPQGGRCDIGAYEFDGDMTAPTVASILRVSPNHTSASSVTFAVTFSEPVLDVSANDFTLHVTGDISGASIGTVTGSGSTRTMTVNTGSGNGTLRLDMPASASITDMTGNSLAGLPFTSGQSYTILKDATFSDVETDYWAWSFIERLVNAGITAGCGGGQYCPESSVTRAQMAIFLLRGIHGASYSPPAVGSSTGFDDVEPTHWAGAWIKQLAAEGITSGCGNGNYCPEASVTRAQMAVFLLRAKHGSSYRPPATGSSTGFGDVQSTHWAAAWIKQLVVEGITAGCGNGNYCPEQAVTRAQMAVFLVRTFSIP